MKLENFMIPSWSDSYLDCDGKVRRGVRPAGPPQQMPRLRQRPRGCSQWLRTGSDGRGGCERCRPGLSGPIWAGWLP